MKTKRWFKSELWERASLLYRDNIPEFMCRDLVFGDTTYQQHSFVCRRNINNITVISLEAMLSNKWNVYGVIDESLYSTKK